jgi:hypothetical protein
MKRIHILTAGFTSSNGQAFLMPLILHRKALMDAGLSVRLFYQPVAELTDCDALLLDGKLFGPRWESQTDSALEEIASYRRNVDNLIYVDLLDSAGWDHARALPVVKLYCKSQLLRDRSRYLRPLYGFRAFTDFYHDEMGVNDDAPVLSEPVPSPSMLDKLTVSWNSGLADYSSLGPYRMHAYQHVPLRKLLRFPKRFNPSLSARSNDLSCRMGTRYIRETVAFQRKRLTAMLKDRVRTDRLSRRRYIAELHDSKVVLSPFGYGEVCYRDFEIFLSGAMMLKPDMSGLETWPEFYRNGETMVAHRWDMSDVIEKLDAIFADNQKRLAIAECGQETYRRHLSSPDAGRLFAEHFKAIIAKGEKEPALQRLPGGEFGRAAHNESV